MIGNEINQIVYKPRVIMALHPVGPTPHPARVIYEHFLCPGGKGNSRFVLPAMRDFLEELSFEQDWIVRFIDAADEALSNACEHATPGKDVRCLLAVVESSVYHFVSLAVENAHQRPNAALPPQDVQYDFSEHLSDERGRGFAIMQQLTDGLVMTVVPETSIQTVIEMHHPRHSWPHK